MEYFVNNFEILVFHIMADGDSDTVQQEFQRFRTNHSCDKNEKNKLQDEELLLRLLVMLVSKVLILKMSNAQLLLL